MKHHIWPENSANMFAFVTEYPEGYNSNNQYYRDDIEYLKSRILTYRSANSGDIDFETSQYYEGARTLVDLLDIIYSASGIDEMRSVLIAIVNSSHPQYGRLPHSRLSFQMKVYRTIFLNESAQILTGNVEITLMYTRAVDKGMGLFIIYGQAVETDGTPIPGLTFTIGDSEVSELYPTGVPEDLQDVANGKCFKAGNILKYSENFPAPSMFANMFVKHLCTICKLIPIPNNFENEE